MIKGTSELYVNSDDVQYMRLPLSILYSDHMSDGSAQCVIRLEIVKQLFVYVCNV